MTSADFNLEEFIKADLKIDQSGLGPKVLIFHTHSQEMYADSKDETEGVLGVGRELCRILAEKYGISVLHDTNRYGKVDGSSQILGAYERMEPSVCKILAENPTIELALDIHRDGVREDRRFVTNINGKPTAQLMFVNGLSKIYRKGTLMTIDSLPNTNRKINLALSFRAQLEGNKQYPGLMRKIYLNAYRYSLHMLPKSMLIEVGAQTNTKEEAWNALEPLADILARVIM
jgi:stage II sporulation protein P